MDKRWLFGLSSLALAACSPAETAVTPEPPLVQIAEVAAGPGAVSRYTGVIRARTESTLGFRVGARSSSVWSIRGTACASASR